MRKCPRCKETKPLLTGFYYNKSRKSKHSSWCRKCENIQKQSRKEVNTKISAKGRAERKKKYNGLYVIWAGVKARCSNPKNLAFKYYGGRGISVCKEWKDNFLAFYDWAINNGRKKGLTIDRKDNDGNYCPENCRFITHKENSRRNSHTKLNIEKVKEIKTLLEKGRLSKTQIGKMFGVKINAIYLINIEKTWADVI